MVFLEKQRKLTISVHPFLTPIFLVESGLPHVTLSVLFCLFYVVCICFHVWSLSLDYILFISARILVPFITL